MPVDSFKFLPRLLTAIYESAGENSWSPPPWTPLPKVLSDCKFGLVTTAGLYHKVKQPPFDLQREMDKPDWGDPSYRIIPVDIAPDEFGVSHLHVNPRWIEEDINVILPIHRFKELVSQGRISGLAPLAYSFMGYQGFPPDTKAWEQVYAPQVAKNLIAEAVDCVLLTPS